MGYQLTAGQANTTRRGSLVFRSGRFLLVVKMAESRPGPKPGELAELTKLADKFDLPGRWTTPGGAGIEDGL